jgi:hypothetical protein
MVISPTSTVPAGQYGGDGRDPDAAGLLAQAAAGPGFWEDLLGELRRAVYRFRTRHAGFELRLVSVGELRHDRGLWLSACCT